MAIAHVIREWLEAADREVRRSKHRMSSGLYSGGDILKIPFLDCGIGLVQEGEGEQVEEEREEVESVENACLP